ncbi:MAG: AAA family ATPase [Dehalococcoidia bacterium]|nr:AAA family ATPase [Dehalococcoidia bacterium]MYK26462.1 AAA family ATPase [Dehalococcoidia bacterium]
MGVSPPTATGGAGYVYEDEVGAYFTAAMLTGATAVEGVTGRIVRLDFQTASLGWALDDLLVTFESSSGELRRIGISAKSGRQFAGATADPDFVRRAWLDLRSQDGHFRPQHDIVALATPTMSQRARDAYQRLRELVTTRQPGEVAASLVGLSNPQRTLWESLRYPPEESVDDEASPEELLAHMRVFDLDFGGDSRPAMFRALEWCGSALADPAEHEKLWNRLLRLSAETRRAGGSLDRSTVLKRTKDFALRDFPPHELAWAAARNMTRRSLEAVREHVGVDGHLSCREFVDAIQNASERLVLLHGVAGCGKTAVAKAWLAAAGQDAVWLNARDCAAAVDGSLLGVRMPELVRAHAAPVAIVVDGLDREFQTEAFVALAELIRGIRGADDSDARVVITAQTHEWQRIGAELENRNASAAWSEVTVSPLQDTEINELLIHMPHLLRVAVQSRVTSVFRNLKMLDVVARSGVAASLGSAVSNESDVAELFSDAIVRGLGERRAGREQTAMSIAEATADRVVADLALDSIGRPDYIDDLERDGLLVQWQGRIRFEHELYGDWVRLKILLSHEADLVAYLEPRLNSPVWHRAIRLYALRLIDNDPETWLDELQRLAAQPALMRDQFLEALLFSADPEGSLERAWDVLIENGGVSLRRFLARFLHAATMTDPRVSASIEDEDPALAVHLRAAFPIPYWPLWIPVLRVLSMHLEDAIELAGTGLLRVVDLWLREIPVGFPGAGRDEAASIAIASATRMIERLGDRWWQESEFRRLAWRALLASVNELPGEVAEVTERLLHHEIEVRTPFPGQLGGSTKGVIVEKDFREVCLSRDGLAPVMSSRPRLAQSTLLACLAPEEVDDEFSTGMGGALGIRDTESRDRLYNEGPFLRFFQIDPMAAAQALAEAVDVATDRWVALDEDAGRPHTAVEFVVGERLRAVNGNSGVMFWYRGEPRVPSVLVSSLMAFEKWLIDSSDAGNDISGVIRHCLGNSTSAAMIGVLASLLCHRPELAKTDLRPLLTVPELYLWDRIYKSQDHEYLLWGFHLRPQVLKEAAHDWHNMPHRKRTITDLALKLFLEDLSEGVFFGELAKAFATLPAERRTGYIDHLIAMFDRGNWTREGESWSYHPPDELLAKNQEFDAWYAEQEFWLGTPRRLRQAIDESTDDSGAADDVSELHAEWEEVVERLQGGVPENLDDLFAPQDISCGIAALLLLRFRNWLRANRDVYAWCRETITSALAASPPRQPLDLPDSIGDWRWDCFAAEGLVVLFADQPDDPELRKAVTDVAFGFRHDPVARLIARMHERREALGEDFRRTQHLVVLGSRDLAEEDAEGFRRQAVQDFVRADLDPEVPDWLSLAIPDPTPRPTYGDGGPLAMSIQRLWANWRFVRSQHDLNDDDRGAWLRHLQLSVELLVARVRRDVDADREEAAGTPYEHEYQLLHGLPAWLLDLDDAADARTLWKPILELGSYAHYWVEAFLHAWVLEGLRAEPVSATFVEIWAEMLDFASSSEAWRRDVGGYGAGDNWAALLGLDWTSIPLWNLRHRPVVEKLEVRFKEWLDDWFDDYDAPPRWARFLQTPAGRVLLEDGFPLLASRFPRDHRYADGQAEDDVASLLAELWAEERERIQSNQELNAAFQSLLRKLVERQNPAAMELSTRIAGISS